MAQPRHRSRPAIASPVASPVAPAEVAPEPPDAEAEQAGWVTCFLSGERVPRERAVLVRIGRGRTMWMSRDLTSQG